jgi:hypothetical protein
VRFRCDRRPSRLRRLVSLEVGAGQREGTQRSQRPWPTRGTCTDTASKRQPPARIVRAAGCSSPSSLRSPEASAGGLKEGPPWAGKNTATRAMGTSRVFHPFPHRHCNIGWPGKKWACFPRMPTFCSLLAFLGHCCAP